MERVAPRLKGVWGSQPPDNFSGLRKPKQGWGDPRKEAYDLPEDQIKEKEWDVNPL